MTPKERGAWVFNVFSKSKFVRKEDVLDALERTKIQVAKEVEEGFFRAEQDEIVREFLDKRRKEPALTCQKKPSPRQRRKRNDYKTF